MAQTQALIRANDPLHEMTFRLGFGHKAEDDFWHQTLKSLAAHFGVDGQVNQQSTLVDPRRQWSQLGNIWYNAGIRSFFYSLAAPLRWVRGLFSR